MSRFLLWMSTAAPSLSTIYLELRLVVKKGDLGSKEECAVAAENVAKKVTESLTQAAPANCMCVLKGTESFLLARPTRVMEGVGHAGRNVYLDSEDDESEDQMDTTAEVETPLEAEAGVARMLAGMGVQVRRVFLQTYCTKHPKYPSYSGRVLCFATPVTAFGSTMATSTRSSPAELGSNPQSSSSPRSPPAAPQLSDHALMASQKSMLESLLLEILYQIKRLLDPVTFYTKFAVASRSIRTATFSAIPGCPHGEIVSLCTIVVLRSNPSIGSSAKFLDQFEVSDINSSGDTVQRVWTSCKVAVWLSDVELAGSRLQDFERLLDERAGGTKSEAKEGKLRGRRVKFNLKRIEVDRQNDPTSTMYLCWDFYLSTALAKLAEYANTKAMSGGR
ncbi:hypothetical protein M427DRAFT_68959 [Gonapodya prolifera JEL478]|uniref:Uncharacterized protein n=1 Tax=Gonapodya prolifera (strain JEL478) TaxID=1344416 RepID=A0A139AIW7_GONPJ|nr:hypothetical protein M427DRAFT_68959 [Gonapodya prolifera JEL478]|eukprot:KXS16668.1 hypothetical protein M427DRAFT_68959 [Gonapodya prolifera JEL478]